MARFEVMHWNDVESRYDALARLSAYARRLRSEAAHPVLLLDAGNVEDSEVRLSGLTYGVSGWRALGASGVDAAVAADGGLLRYGPGRLPAYAEALGSPVLLANVTQPDGAFPPGAVPSPTVRAGDIAIGIIGVASWVPAYADFGLAGHDVVETVREEARQLRLNGAHVVILLSHAGLADDRRVAAELGDLVDLVVGGRDEVTLPEGDRAHGVPIVQAGAFAEQLGRVVVDVEDGQVTVGPISVETPPPDIAPDPAVLASVRESEHELRAWLADPVATLPHAFGHSATGSSEVAGLVADALLAYVPADLAMVLGARCTAGLPAGEVTAATSAPANATTATLTGAELREVIVRGRSADYVSAPSTVFRGRPFGWLHLSNAAVVGEDDLVVAGERVDDARRYRVVATDVELGPLGRLVDREPPDRQLHTPTIVPEFLEAYLAATFP
ncbi:bifunctional metallophosphatase/5'-nucleotidase [Luteipulveratus halotolerans]|uniref:5'-Nucleotidase C-terminal domain-containing protein n=1 Tax=Luteipulveratus halotolerans TaxID=1631356 RepID=A0A0L6CDN5_9MICO|nr:bifunctional metallophosphatase/5'-nucleotidase [Luteipulveratus halotolerans]KNX35971.1 hypothetical protein VV01_00445 [Luteipulveratus halotolerans]